MRHLNSNEIPNISGGDRDSDFMLGLFLTPDDLTASNAIAAAVYGGGLVGGFIGGKYGYTNTQQSYIGAIAGAVGGMVGGAIVGGAASAAYLSVTQPIFNFLNTRFS